MTVRHRTAFFAYPEQPRELAAPIETAAASAGGPNWNLDLTLWPQLETFGSNIPDEIRKQIRDTDVLLCDITRPNQNVYYEIGFAIGSGKTIAPVVNVSFANATHEIKKDGIFDNISYFTYENSKQLRGITQSLPDTTLADLYAKCPFGKSLSLGNRL